MSCRSDVASDVGEGKEEVPEVELEPQAQDTLAQVARGLNGCWAIHIPYIYTYNGCIDI
jgi:hypothetical protein